MESNGSSGYSFCIESLAESDGRQIAESSLLSNAVIEDLDVFGDLAFSLLAGSEALVMNQFSFQGTPATFHRRVIPTVSLSAHGNVHTELAEQFLVSQ